MTDPSDDVAPHEQCPRCESPRVVACESPLMFGFIPKPQKPRKFVWSNPEVYACPPFRICLACGMLWASVDTCEATRIIRALGTDELKRRVLDVPEALPLPSAAPTPEAESLPLPAGLPALDPNQLPRPQEP